MLWPSHHDDERDPVAAPRRKRAAGLYLAVLHAAEDAAVTRARLTSRHHPATRTAEFRKLLARQEERRDATYRTLARRLEEQLGADHRGTPPADGSSRSPRA